MNKFTKAIAAIMLMMIIVFSLVGCHSNTNHSSVSGKVNGHDFVDLGLPSGTLWATCNIGAEKPEDFGGYFAWGEINTKDTYNWTFYKYNPYSPLFGSQKWLQAENDAATVNWGDGWCTPDFSTWMELYQNTTNIWTIQNGVNGRLFSANNGRTLFLPASGKICDSDFGGERTNCYFGECGYYWTSALNTDKPRYAIGFYFDSTDYGVSAMHCRSEGRTIRPVHIAK